VAESENTRLEAFSDGIFAIAITLLILDVKVPEAKTARELIRALAAAWPAYSGYLLSFLIIGIMWSNHHLIFRHIRRSDHTLMMVNVLLMMTIAFLPYPTAVLAHNFENPDTRAAATMFYSGAMFMTSIPFSWLWIHAVNAKLVDGPEAERARITRSFRVGWISWLVATIVAAVAPVAAVILMGVSSLYWMIFPSRRKRA
jgi:uncharacterized membrane protein